MRFNPATAYETITRLDELVKHRHLIPWRQSWNPKGGGAIPLPGKLRQWLRHADEADVVEFWELLIAGKWRAAKRMAKLRDKDIEFLLEVIWNDRDYKGKASPERYRVHGMLVSEIWRAYRMLPKEHRQIIDKYRMAEAPPPWPGVRREDRMAFAALADKLNAVKMGEV